MSLRAHDHVIAGWEMLVGDDFWIVARAPAGVQLDSHVPFDIYERGVLARQNWFSYVVGEQCPSGQITPPACKNRVGSKNSAELETALCIGVAFTQILPFQRLEFT
jgi:hypothetical protein